MFFRLKKWSHDRETFFSWNCGVWGERGKAQKRVHWKQSFLKRPSQCRPCAAIRSVLTELSRGMEKIIHRNVWGALKRSGPRDWPMGERPVSGGLIFSWWTQPPASQCSLIARAELTYGLCLEGPNDRTNSCLEKKGDGVLDGSPSFFIWFY